MPRRRVQSHMRPASVVAALALAGTLAACGGEAPADSGVEGMVLLGPQCPVVQEGVPCPDKPFAAEIRVVEAGSGDLVATVRSSADGRFRVRLAPGDYVLEPVSPGESGLPFGKPVDVTVRAHSFTQVSVTFDTGIR